MNLSFEDEELTEFGLDHADAADEGDPSIESQSQASRGRPRIPEKWTRVMNVDSANLANIKTHAIASDLLLSSGVPKDSSKKKQPAWAPIFYPKDYVKEHKNIKAQDHELGQEDLMRYGKQVSLIRAGFLNQALAHAVAHKEQGAAATAGSKTKKEPREPGLS